MDVNCAPVVDMHDDEPLRQSLLSCLARLGISRDLAALVALRTAQLGRCECCMKLHAGHLSGPDGLARAAALPGWRGSALFDPRERAALEMVELLRRDQAAPTTAHVYDAVLQCFSERQVAGIVLIINTVGAFGLAWKTHFMRRSTLICA